MISVYKTIVLMLALVVVSCASTKPGRLSTHTSAPKPVDAVADNAQLLSQFTPGLVIILEISDNTTSLVDARIALVPRSTVRRQEGELIKITGLSNGTRVSSVAVPDQRINVEEEKGLVILDKRTLTATLPLPRKIDTLEVQLPGDVAPSLFNIRKQIDSFCRKFTETEFCVKPARD